MVLKEKRKILHSCNLYKGPPGQWAARALNNQISPLLLPDGFYLTVHLLSLGYDVHGIARHHTSSISHFDGTEIWQRDLSSVKSVSSMPAWQDRLHVHYGDILDSYFLSQVFAQRHFDEIYHFAAQSHVGTSFDNPLYTADVNAQGTLRLLHTILAQRRWSQTRFYNACTSEIFGRVDEDPQTEKTAFRPLSPYATAKLSGYWTTCNVRSSHGLFAVNGILFNHESPRRGQSFVTRKITTGVAAITCGARQEISLGNLDSSRDWGHAKEYVLAIHAMLQQAEPIDLVIATGQTHTVRQFAEEAFRSADMPIRWEGLGESEVGVEARSGTVRVRVDPSLYRSNDVSFLRGCADKAAALLNWSPSVTFKELVQEMVAADIARMSLGRQIHAKDRWTAEIWRQVSFD